MTDKTNKGQQPNRVLELWKYDGVDHINIGQRANTELGRRLSQYAYEPFVHPYHGHFDSLEGFWYYMRIEPKTVEEHKRRDQLRYLAGEQARQHGLRFRDQLVRPRGFREEILGCIYQKIIQRPGLKEEFVASTLPFHQYYLMSVDPRNPKAHKTIGWVRDVWITEGLELMRTEMKEDKIPSVWATVETHYQSQS